MTEMSLTEAIAYVESLTPDKLSAMLQYMEYIDDVEEAGKVLLRELRAQQKAMNEARADYLRQRDECFAWIEAWKEEKRRADKAESERDKARTVLDLERSSRLVHEEELKSEISRLKADYHEWGKTVDYARNTGDICRQDEMVIMRESTFNNMKAEIVRQRDMADALERGIKRLDPDAPNTEPYMLSAVITIAEDKYSTAIEKAFFEGRMSGICEPGIVGATAWERSTAKREMETKS